MRDGEAQFGVVRRRDQIVGVLSVETDTRVVGELAGSDNDDVDLPAETMDASLTEIDARIDDTDEGRAARVGAIAVGAIRPTRVGRVWNLEDRVKASLSGVDIIATYAQHVLTE